MMRTGGRRGQIRRTGFTNAEETRAGFADKAKWLLQDRLVARRTAQPRLG